jgi:transketolase
MINEDQKYFEDLARLIRYYSLVASTRAGSGHPTSSMSATDVMAYQFFHEFRFDFKRPDNPNNDRLIFSKGHASPLYFSLFTAAGAITEKKLMSFRKFGSPIEGHPTVDFKYTEVPTGSLGQGLSVGVGMAINGKYLDRLPYTTYVLLGDGEMAEGSVWEAMSLAAYYKLGNLVAILDANRLGQSDPTMLGHDLNAYVGRARAFGWEAIVVDGHNFSQIEKAFQKLNKVKNKPKMIVAKTFKGRGFSEVENKNNWHGKPLSKDLLKRALKELGPVDKKLRGTVAVPEQSNKSKVKSQKLKKVKKPVYKLGEEFATRKVYGEALAWYGSRNRNIVAVDGDVKNSTYSEIFKKAYPGRFFDMFIAEQNMVGVALGLAKRGKIPFASTFAAFFSRAYDQIRMSQFAGVNINYCGSHAGVSIGEDGGSQMGLEDLSMFRALHGSTVLYPSDATSTFKLVGKMFEQPGVCYMRTTRGAAPTIYKQSESFPVGGSKIHKFEIRNSKFEIVPKALVVAAGVTLHEALKAQEQLAKKRINIRVIDAYSVKPIDSKTIRAEAKELELIKNKKHVFVVEDHWPEGGLGDAVLNVFASGGNLAIHKLAVTKIPHSGKPAENLAYQGIESKGIIKAIKNLL